MCSSTVLPPAALPRLTSCSRTAPNRRPNFCRPEGLDEFRLPGTARRESPRLGSTAAGIQEMEVWEMEIWAPSLLFVPVACCRQELHLFCNGPASFPRGKNSGIFRDFPAASLLPWQDSAHIPPRSHQQPHRPCTDHRRCSQHPGGASPDHRAAPTAADPPTSSHNPDGGTRQRSSSGWPGMARGPSLHSGKPDLLLGR